MDLICLSSTDIYQCPRLYREKNIRAGDHGFTANNKEIEPLGALTSREKGGKEH